MDQVDTNLKNILHIALKRINMEISFDIEYKIYQYINSILEWNNIYNITAFKSKEQILIYHIIDTLSIIYYLKKEMCLFHRSSIQICDVGSGCGVPGIVLGIMNHDWDIHCVDSVEKKISFIKYVKGCLNLKNIKPLHSRIELLSNFSYDIIISRAFSSLNNFVNLSGKHLKKNGFMIAMKGHMSNEEIDGIKNNEDWYIKKIEDINVPYINAKRCLVFIDKKIII